MCAARYCSPACRQWHHNNDHCKAHTRHCVRCWRLVGTYSPLFAQLHDRKYHIPKDRIVTQQRVSNLLASGVLCSACHDSHEQWAVDTKSCHKVPDAAQVEGIIQRAGARTRDADECVEHNKRLLKESCREPTRQNVVSQLLWLRTQPRHLKDDKQYYKAFWNACVVGNEGLAYELLQRDAPYTAKHFECACYNGPEALVAMLLKDTRCIPSANKSSSMQYAAFKGHATIVSALLRDGRADPSACANKALRIAAKNGHASVVRLLLSDTRVDPTLGKALANAVRHNKADVVAALLSDHRVAEHFVQNELDLLDEAGRWKRWAIMEHLLGAMEPDRGDAFVSRLDREGRYQHGMHVLQSSRDDAMRWLRSAARAGHTRAALLCGHYEREAGNVESALQYYDQPDRIIIEEECGQRFYWCAVTTGDCGQHVRAMDYLHKAVRCEDMPSMVRLGEYYAHLRGAGATRLDMVRARQLWMTVIRARFTGTYKQEAQRLLDSTSCATSGEGQ